MKRRTKLRGWSQFGAVALALLSTVACAARSSGTRTEVVGDLEWKYVAEGNGAAAVVSVAYANGDKQVRGTVTVPAAFEGGSLPVEGIGFRAFFRQALISEVVLPPRITYLGNDCFHSCVRLTSVSLPPAVRKIGGSAFYGCTALKTVSLNAGLATIGTSAFGKCTSLESVALPATLTEVGDSAFAGSGLVQIAVPDSVKELGGSAFASCDHLVSASIGRSVVVLPFRAFFRCGNLASVTIADGALDTIGNDCFHSCSRLASLKLAKPLQEIKVGKNAFYGTPLDPQQGGRGRRGRR